jgi:signal transduction histidine kinase
MQQIVQTTGLQVNNLAGSGLAAISGADRKRVEAVVETLANLRGEGENVAEVAHDARNMVTALGLYCDLLEEPGVLNPVYQHYGSELRLVATASRRLVEKLVALDVRTSTDVRSSTNAAPVREASAARAEETAVSRLDSRSQESSSLESSRPQPSRHWDLMPAAPIENLAKELLANRNLLAALAGPAIALTVDVEGGAMPVRLTGEDLTRILVNLVKNAAEAMPGGGRISIGLHEFHAGTEIPPWLLLSVEDNGPGVPKKVRESIFESGYTTRTIASSTQGGWPASHRGLGLSITRSIIEAAGGHIHAVHRAPKGARFEIELPSGLR